MDAPPETAGPLAPPPSPRIDSPRRKGNATRLFHFVREMVRLRAHDSDRPRVVTHTVTFRCNAKCMMCDSWRLPGQDELTTEEVERIYAALPTVDVLRLTGGEPFLRKDLGAIVSLGVRHLDPRFIHITTNGFLTERIIDLAERRDLSVPLQLLVSIDGVAGKHDDVRGVPGSYGRAMATIEELAPRRRELNLQLAVNQTVVDAEGAGHYGHLRDILAALKVPLHLVVAYKESATYSTVRDLARAVDGADAYETYGSFTRAEIGALLDAAERDLALLGRPERMAKGYYLAGLRRRLLGEDGPASPACVALHAHLRIFPNGDVPTCQQNTQIVGNLREARFDEVWAGATAHQQRAWVKACAGCWAECEVLPSAIYTGELLRHALRRPARHAASKKQPRVSAHPIVPRSDRGEVSLPSDVPSLTPPVASNLPAPADEAKT